MLTRRWRFSQEEAFLMHIAGFKIVVALVVLYSSATAPAIADAGQAEEALKRYVLAGPKAEAALARTHKCIRSLEQKCKRQPSGF